MLCGVVRGTLMNNVVPFKRRSASAKVIEKLVSLGYLKTSSRRDDAAIERALARLERDLREQGSIEPEPPKSV